jgi:AcrR family transcriptional regulator
MSRVNLARRAELGSAKWARTRAAILDAARLCYGAGPVTVDAVMQEAAGLAKGTFYVHFEDLASLEKELGAALIAELDEQLQPARLAVSDPLTRLPPPRFCCAIWRPNRRAPGSPHMPPSTSQA